MLVTSLKQKCLIEITLMFQSQVCALSLLFCFYLLRAKSVWHSDVLFKFRVLHGSRCEVVVVHTICMAFNCCYLPLTFSPARGSQECQFATYVRKCLRCEHVLKWKLNWKVSQKKGKNSSTWHMHHLQQCYY